MMKIMLAILLAMLPIVASAGDLWLDGGFFTHHIPESRGMREVNPGLGVQYDLNDSVSLVGGQYLNSLGGKSNYYGVFVGYRSGIVKVGAQLASINGYKWVNNGNEFYGIVPTLSVEGETFGFNIVTLPPIVGVNGLVAIQFKVKIK